MKFKGIFFISSILMIFIIIGSVSSADEMDCENLTLETDNSEISLQSDENYACDVSDTIIDKNSHFINIDFSKNYDFEGNLSVCVDEEVYYDAPMKNKLMNYEEFHDESSSVYSYSIEFRSKDFDKPLKYGFHNVVVKHSNNGTEKILINTTFKADYYFSVVTDSLIYYGDSDTLSIDLPKDADGVLTVTYNGKTKKLKYDNKGFVEFTVSSYELKLGENKIYAKLTGDSKYPELSSWSTVEVNPKILPSFYDVVTSIGEKEYITIKVPKSMSGTFKIYNTVKKLEYDEYESSYYNAYYKGNKVLAQVKVVNGVGKIPLNKFSKGYHILYLEYKSGKYVYGGEFRLIVIKNNPKVKVSFSSKSVYEGSKVKATVKSPKTTNHMDVFVDGEMVSTWDIKIKYGKSVDTYTKVFSKLKPGTHKIRFIFNGDEKIKYAKTFKIKVKPKVSLKAGNVAVKKSSKKFTLKATLKIKGKLAKSKKVSFKLNGKVYKAKTNKKGICKVTLKKSVLKKVRIGQKIKYQVSYDNKSINKKIVIKK